VLLAVSLTWRMLRRVLTANPAAPDQKLAGKRRQQILSAKPAMRRGVLVMLMTLLSTPVTALCQQDISTSAEVLTLEQAIAISLRDNHRVKSAELGVGKTED